MTDQDKKLGTPHVCPGCGQYQNSGLKLPEECRNCEQDKKYVCPDCGIELYINDPPFHNYKPCGKMDKKQRLFKLWCKTKLGDNYILPYAFMCTLGKYKRMPLSEIQALMIQDGVSEDEINKIMEG